ncbi:MAG: hypothetical protein ACRDQ5_14600, partial [Sciscionella sp.]
AAVAGLEEAADPEQLMPAEDDVDPGRVTGTADAADAEDAAGDAEGSRSTENVAHCWRCGEVGEVGYTGATEDPIADAGIPES